MNSEWPSQLARGTQLASGKYEILEAVGSGGMGQVYKARHLVLNRVVAIKVLHPVMTAFPKAKARFLREAQAASRLSHPCSVQVIDFGSEDDAFFYLVMEFLEGVELTQIIKERAPLAPETIISIASQVCGALAAAHDEGIIHRDLKPANIMVTDAIDDDGRPYQAVKVCDFGIAKIQSDEDDSTAGAQLTDTGVVTGTPTYMSPEQARGKPLDARSDIYACGVILYQMLTGRLPFQGENALGILMQHISDTPQRPSALEPGVHSGLEAVALKCLAKFPEQRYADARALRAALLSSIDLSIPLALPARPSSAGPQKPRASSDKIGPFAGPTAFGETLEVSGPPPARQRRQGLWIAGAIFLVSAAALGGFLYLQAPKEPSAGGARTSSMVRSQAPTSRQHKKSEDPAGDSQDAVTRTKSHDRKKAADRRGEEGPDSDSDSATDTELDTADETAAGKGGAGNIPETNTDPDIFILPADDSVAPPGVDIAGAEPGHITIENIGGTGSDTPPEPQVQEHGDDSEL